MNCATRTLVRQTWLNSWRNPPQYNHHRMVSTSQYAVVPPPRPSVPIYTSENIAATTTAVCFPVHRIYCVGRNYADHAIEMGGDPNRESPFFFHKPADAVVPCASNETDNPANVTKIPYPLATNNLHHEIELVVAIGGDTSTASTSASSRTNISLSDAPKHIFGYAVGVDLTRRDLQAVAKQNGRPWCSSKGFDDSAPIGAIYPVRRDDSSNVEHKKCSFLPRDAAIWLSVNGQEKQRSRINHMTWSVPEIISILSTQYTLQPGDLIYTGTPAGVGPLCPGDCVVAGINTLGELSFQITPRSG